MEIDKTMELKIFNSSNKEDIGRHIRVMDILEEVLDTKKLNCYKEVLEHRRRCDKWGKEFCLECFGGGLTKFLETIKKELYSYKTQDRTDELIEEFLKVVKPSQESAKLSSKVFSLIGEQQGTILALTLRLKQLERELAVKSTKEKEK